MTPEQVRIISKSLSQSLALLLSETRLLPAALALQFVIPPLNLGRLLLFLHPEPFEGQEPLLFTLVPVSPPLLRPMLHRMPLPPVSCSLCGTERASE